MKKLIQEGSKIKILKYKMAINRRHIYIYCIVIANIETKNILKILCTTSYNPAIFELSLEGEITEIDKNLYKFKLEEDIPEVSRNIYLKLYNSEESVTDAIKNEKIDKITEIIKQASEIRDEDLKVEYLIENYIHKSYNKSDIELKLDNAINTLQTTKFFIKTKPVIDEKRGIPADKLKLKMKILCRSADDREIAKYIMKILFSENKKEFFAKIIEISTKYKNYYKILCSITPTIFTEIILNKTQKVIVED